MGVHGIYSQSELLTSGAMAKLCSTSKKALQVYLEKGIFTPRVVDKDNGYRYYTYEQVPQLEEVIRMREVGLSLDEIKEIVNNKDSLLYLGILHARLDALDIELEQKLRDRALLQARIDNQMMFLNPPALKHCFVEYQTRRRYVRYPFEPYLATEDTGARWQEILNDIREEFHTDEIPVKYFNNVGSIVDMKAYEEGKIMYSAAMIVPTEGVNMEGERYLEAGYYACMFDLRYMSDGAAIAEAVDSLVSFVKEGGYSIRGDYVQESVAETTMFDFNRTLYVVKEQIPINLDS